MVISQIDIFCTLNSVKKMIFFLFCRGGHHQWTGSQRHFGDVHRSNSSSDRDAFEKPRVPQSPARSLSQTSRKSPKMKRKQSNSTSRSRSGSSDSSSSSSYSDSSSDSSRSRSRSGRSVYLESV